MNAKYSEAERDGPEALLDELVGAGNLDSVIPRLARDKKAIQRIESVVHVAKTAHDLTLGDARTASALPDESVHLVVTSPPYWTLKRYKEHPSQLGRVDISWESPGG